MEFVGSCIFTYITQGVSPSVCHLQNYLSYEIKITNYLPT